MKRLAFILSPLLVQGLQEIDCDKSLMGCKSKWEPVCFECGRKDEHVKALNAGDDIVLYICEAGHTFSEPWEAKNDNSSSE